MKVGFDRLPKDEPYPKKPGRLPLILTLAILGALAYNVLIWAIQK